jgi:hypothetical protein
MANVSTKNNGVQHSVLATPIKLLGASDLIIKLNAFLDIPP